MDRQQRASEEKPFSRRDAKTQRKDKAYKNNLAVNLKDKQGFGLLIAHQNPTAFPEPLSFLFFASLRLCARQAFAVVFHLYYE